MSSPQSREDKNFIRRKRELELQILRAKLDALKHANSNLGESVKPRGRTLDRKKGKTL